MVALCGCSMAPPPVPAPPQLRSQTATPTYSTAKSPQLFTKCLQDAFGPVEAVRFGVRAEITTKSGLKLDLFDGGTVRVRRPHPLDDDTRRRLERCL